MGDKSMDSRKVNEDRKMWMVWMERGKIRLQVDIKRLEIALEIVEKIVKRNNDNKICQSVR